MMWNLIFDWLIVSGLSIAGKLKIHAKTTCYNLFDELEEFLYFYLHSGIKSVRTPAT